MFCKYCGKQIHDDAKYCGYCGQGQSESVKASSNNSKAIFCFFISIIAEIMVIFAPFTKLINVEFHYSQSMLKETILSVGAIDIIDKVDILNNFPLMPDELSSYLDKLSVLTYLIIANVVVCAFYLLIYVARYSYNGQNQKASRFGIHFEKYASAPSIIMAVIVLILIKYGSSSLGALKEYISIKPATGTIIIIISAIVHIVINCISDDCRKEVKTNKAADETNTETSSADKAASTSNDTAAPVTSGALAKLSGIAKDKNDEGTWNCGDCGTLNSANSVKCVNCGKSR